MKNKEKYYRAIIENDDQLNEIDLGTSVGLNEDETTKIIAQLLSEYKIEYVDNRVCKYSPMKKVKKKNNSK
ncbi:hypothetical protein HX004_16070 [Myroides sp. 1354]|uniref:hypothetical protein n=1 Tax=unclassified Myroides TaxID=2642485 RepID=UPI002574F72A|nr:MULTISPECIES: hypothetical protein [unclassified Myroides]MDM1046339.1 hypothetical protein [Myroides sp. R163-1]MDM1057276.1 hypothetical protein [Myroides sp. 1354]MDM1070489.1 hypothetical protein [Myroides sp. 1372]